MSAFTEYIDAWKIRDSSINEKVRLTQEKLTIKLPEISTELKSLGAKKVIVFGSIIEGNFKAGSDVDLAVQGLPEDKYIDALIAVEKILMSVGVDFDLVLYERAYPWIRVKIEKGRTI